MACLTGDDDCLPPQWDVGATSKCLGSIRTGRLRRVDPPARGLGPRQGIRRERIRTGAKSFQFWNAQKRRSAPGPKLTMAASRSSGRVRCCLAWWCRWLQGQGQQRAHGCRHSVKSFAGGQWITGIVMPGHKLGVERKLHGVLRRARLVRSRVPGPDWSTGVGSTDVSFVAQPAFIGPPHLRVGPSGCGGYPP
jgi:hypothetical protein